LITTRNPKKLQFILRFLWIRQELFRRPRIWRRRETAHPSKNIHISQSEVSRLSATHRETKQSPLLPIFFYCVFLFDARNQIIEQVTLKGRKGLHFIRSHNVSRSPVILHRTTIGQYDNHRLYFSVCI